QRLEDEVELLGGDRAAEVGLEPHPVLLLRLELGREIAGATAAGVLRLVQGKVGLEDEVVDGGAGDRAESAPDRDADADLGLVDHIGLTDRGDDPVGELFDRLAALGVVDDDRELIAAHAADGAIGGNLVDETLGDGAQDGVALRVAEGVVDRLEAIEVEEHDRARHIAAGRAPQRLAEELTDAAAIWAGPTGRRRWRG